MFELTGEFADWVNLRKTITVITYHRYVKERDGVFPHCTGKPVGFAAGST